MIWNKNASTVAAVDPQSSRFSQTSMAAIVTLMVIRVFEKISKKFPSHVYKHSPKLIHFSYIKLLSAQLTTASIEDPHNLRVKTGADNKHVGIFRCVNMEARW